MIGTTIGHYKILEKLGEGGMGVVYKAEDVVLRRLVALKVLPSRAVATEEAKARFVREAQAAASLSHPHIATVYEFGEADGESFLAMEYIDGTSLDALIKKGPLSIDEAVRIGAEVADGLAKAHEKGIMHRDIKPENIMLTLEGAAKIMDFGLAEMRGHSRITQESSTMGTVSYMSPEQARGEALDERTDIWSLGVVLYEVLTGQLPFPGHYESAILYLVVHEEPESIKKLRSDAPSRLVSIVEKCLKKDPGERYRNGKELYEELNALRKALEQGVARGVEREEEKPEQKRFETERRPVTILFSALSTAAQGTEETDPELLTTGLNECFDGLIGIIRKYEGMADRIVGDKLMAVFGAPVAHENDPERAVRCAQEMMSYVTRITALGMAQLSEAMQLKIGMHTGVVVAGSVGTAGESGYSVVGDVVNVAAGIVDVVPPGKICLSADVQKLVAGIAEVEDPRMIAVRGKAQEMRIFDLRSLKVGIEPGRRMAEGGAFVGRTEEIKSFEEAIERVQKKAEVRLFVRGEAGVGKTRLKNELVARAERRQMAIVEGKCSSFEINTPYYLWNTFLKSLLRVDPDTSEFEVRSRLHEMVKTLALEPDEPYLASLLSLRSQEILLEEDEERKAKMYSAARRLLNGYAERKRAVFVFEDLHWIDRFSQALLEFVLKEERVAPALIVCLFRPEYRDGEGFFRTGRQFDLDRLTDVQARELMCLRFNAESIPDQLASLIEQRSEGNPFFIEELIKTLLDRGIVSVKKGKLEVQSEKLESGVPETLQGVILSRIDQLEGRIREVLLDASVIGREFSRPVLEHIIQKKFDVGAGLKKLQSLELVFEKEDARELEYLFKHYLIQEVAYNTLLQKKRKQLHALIARAIEKLYADRLKEFYEILAFHYEKAEEWGPAADYLSRAGNKMREFYTNEESKDFSERTNAAKAKLVEGKGVKNRVLILYRLIFGLMFSVWFLTAMSLLLASFSSPRYLSASGIVFLRFGAVFYAVFSLWGGLRFFQVLRPRPKGFELFGDHIEVIFNDGTSRTLDFSDIHIIHFYEEARPTWRYFAEEMYLSVKLGSLRRRERINPASFGFGSKKGEIHIRRKGGLSFFSRESLFKPWKYNLLNQRDLALTPANPDEFYEQLLVAFEKWRVKTPPKERSHRQETKTSSVVSRRMPPEEAPLFTFRPVFKVLAVIGTLHIGWYFLALSLLLFLALAIVSGGSGTPGGILFLVFWDGLWFTLLILLLVSPFLIRKRMADKCRYEFFLEKMRFSTAGINPGPWTISYSDIISVELLNKKIHAVFNVGGIFIKTNTVALISEGTRLAETALVIPDVPDAEHVITRINELIDAFKQRERLN